MIGRASITLVADHARLALALAGRIALGANRAVPMTTTVHALVGRLAAIVRVLAVLAVGAVRVALTVDAVAAVACLLVQRLIEHTLVRQAITVACFFVVVVVVFE